MSFEGLEPVADPSVGNWIARRLRGIGGRVHCVVPDGYAAYARIPHPASDADGRELRWSEVCRQTGRTAHALMQWESITDGRGSPPESPPPGLPDEVMVLPRLSLPGRDHLLFRGPLQAAGSMGHQFGGRFDPQSPSLLWPEDRSWCLATEIDFDSTLVGGPAELIDALLAEPRLEAWPLDPSDDLTINGDVVNS